MRAFEQDFPGQDRRSHRPDRLNRLRDVQSKFRVLRRAAERNERIPRNFEGRHPEPHDEVGDQERRKGGEHRRGPEDQRAARVYTQPRDKCSFEPPLPKDNPAERQRRDEVRAEVSSMQSDPPSGTPSHQQLKLGVQHVQQAVRKSPQKEENRDKRERSDGFPGAHLHHAFRIFDIDKIKQSETRGFRSIRAAHHRCLRGPTNRAWIRPVEELHHTDFLRFGFGRGQEVRDAQPSIVRRRSRLPRLRLTWRMRRKVSGVNHIRPSRIVRFGQRPSMKASSALDAAKEAGKHFGSKRLDAGDAGANDANVNFHGGPHEE